ncbi:hypothetical protein R1flu_026801 [Riccia fluitans]|uniref:Uncharacterized protein n=1 Tax=Riccia fluitans TaxID=41844 RepID=A0ABD1XGZ0_9MARC
MHLSLHEAEVLRRFCREISVLLVIPQNFIGFVPGCASSNAARISISRLGLPETSEGQRTDESRNGLPEMSGASKPQGTSFQQESINRELPIATQFPTIGAVAQWTL